MVQPKQGKDNMPDKQKTEKNRKILDLDAHVQKFMKCDGVVLEIHHGGSQYKHRDHYEQVEELECCQ